MLAMESDCLLFHSSNLAGSTSSDPRCHHDADNYLVLLPSIAVSAIGQTNPDVALACYLLCGCPLCPVAYVLVRCVCMRIEYGPR